VTLAPHSISPGPSLGVAAHPLDPLTPQEIASTAAILRAERGLADSARFVFIELHEPAKELVTDWQPGDSWDRRAFAVVREQAEQATYEMVVSLSRGEVVSWRQVPDAQPPITLEEFLACEELIRQDPRWQKAMGKRGVTDFSLAMIDKWASGYTGEPDAPGAHRLARPLTFVRSGPDDNGYARPVENLIVTVDLDTMEVLEVADHGVVPLPPHPGNYAPALITGGGNVPTFPSVREAMRPLSITQPDGPSFQVEGQAVTWGNWRLRVGFTPREGLVLHDIRYTDRGTVRPVVYRASLSEMYVPYGDPSATHWNKNVFDEGEYGLGVLANSLQLGCDCLGEIHYFDAWVNDQDGGPVRLPNAICMHEEDFSIGWKHTDFRTGVGEVRRNRRLVISFFATVGNYDYGFYWNLYLDGSIELEIKLTGVISTGALPPGETSEYGTVVAPGLYGPNHQHFFSVRMDMQVDGDRNNLYELESTAVPVGPDNPHGNAWRQTKRQLTCESEAKRVADPLRCRAWLVTSTDRRNVLGGETGYKLEPGANVLPFFQEGSQQMDRGRFATKHLWATPYDPSERYAAGEYVAQNPGGDGLPAYTGKNRSLRDADLVLWYTLGAHHVVRPEDWPVMPVSRVSMHLKPVGFFDGNPMLDLPSEKPAEASGGCCSHAS
jgi:primary-amine oxidase